MSGDRSGSDSYRDWPRSERWPWCGRSEGTKKSTSDASENCTSMCTDVVNMGKGKLSLDESNIHLLYWAGGLVNLVYLEVDGHGREQTHQRNAQREQVP